MTFTKTIFLVILCVTISVKPFKIKEKEEINSKIKKLSAQCNMSSNLQYRDLEVISKNTWMAFSFQKIQRDFWKIDDTTWTSESNITYFLPRVIVEYLYKDVNQTAKFGQTDIILVEGGYIQIQFSFYVYIRNQVDQRYSKILEVKALANSRQMLYSLYPQNPKQQQYYRAGLLLKQLSNAVFDKFEITSIEPCDSQNVTAEDIDAINYILYKGASNTDTIKFELERIINKNLKYLLSGQIQSSNDSVSTLYYTKYIWKNIYSEKYVQISPYLDNTFIRFEKTTNTGIYYGYNYKIRQLKNQTCSSSSIIAPLDSKIYGKKQEFLSYTFYRNAIMYALELHSLDTVLNRTLWATKSFRYFAGQLFPIFADLDKKFYSNAQVNGTCVGIPQSLSVGKGKNQTFKVNLDYSCNIFVEKLRIVQFNTSLQIDVQGIPVNQTIDFEVQDVKFKTDYDDSFGFKLINKTLADQFVYQAVNRLFEESLFGSGWPVFLKRENPQFKVLDNYTLIYDQPTKS